MNLTPGQKMAIHMAAGFSVPATLFSVLPNPWGALLGAVAAAAVAFFAFLDQSISKE